MAETGAAAAAGLPWPPDAGRRTPAERRLDLAARSGAGQTCSHEPGVGMGFFSWLSRWREDPSAGRPTLIFRNDEDDPAVDEVRRAAAADVAAVEQDDKFFGPDAPANQDEGL